MRWDPSRFTVRCAQPMPAQLMMTRSGALPPAAASTAACTEASSETSVATNVPPDLGGQLGALVLIQVSHENGAACGGQRAGGGLAEAARPTRNDRCGSVHR